MSRVLLCFPRHAALGRLLAARLQARFTEVMWRHFPDKESLIAIDESLRDADVSVLASLHDPDGIALPLRFTAETAREFGARSIGLIAPYLGYMRQDHRFHPGEARSAPLFARFLEGSFDWLATVDPHLHRITTLNELFAIPVANVSAAPVIAKWIRAEVPDAVLIGPDAESAQWVSRVAAAAGVPWQCLEKKRLGDREVEVSALGQAGLRGRTPVLLDDMVSTGHTLMGVLAHLRALGLPPAVCIATHAVFTDEAFEKLLAAGAARVVTCDTIPHPSNLIGIGELMAAAVEPLFRGADTGTDSDAGAADSDWFDTGEPHPE